MKIPVWEHVGVDHKHVASARIQPSNVSKQVIGIGNLERKKKLRDAKHDRVIQIIYVDKTIIDS